MGDLHATTKIALFFRAQGHVRKLHDAAVSELDTEEVGEKPGCR